MRYNNNIISLHGLVFHTVYTLYNIMYIIYMRVIEDILSSFVSHRNTLYYICIIVVCSVYNKLQGVL